MHLIYVIIGKCIETAKVYLFQLHVKFKTTRYRQTLKVFFCIEKKWNLTDWIYKIIILIQIKKNIDTLFLHTIFTKPNRRRLFQLHVVAHLFIFCIYDILGYLTCGSPWRSSRWCLYKNPPYCWFIISNACVFFFFIILDFLWLKYMFKIALFPFVHV